MKVLICGVGSIGLRHARILSGTLGHEVYALRSTRQPLEHGLNVKEIFAWSDVEKVRPEAAFVTNPTNLHLETALRCASLGMHLFIEKPLSHTTDNVEALESLCREKSLTCYVAYCLRFHPVIKKLREVIRGKKIYHARIVCSSFLPAWRPDQDYSKSYSVSSREGGGVLLDLSHELDYAKYIFGEFGVLTGFYGRASDLTVDAEDFADVLIKTVNPGCCLNLHLNFNSLINERTITVDFEDGYARGDLIGNRLESLVRGVAKVYEYTVDRDGYLADQSKYFFDNIGNASIMNSLAEAKQLLGSILAFKKNGRI
jgi:predicted dehydrogenase